MSDSRETRSLISPDDMQVIEHVLTMRGGYVLNFTDRTFDEFIAHETGLDATAPRYSADGTSKAKRLRKIIPDLTFQHQAKLLRAFLRYRDNAGYIGNRMGVPEPLDNEWRQRYEAIVDRLEKGTPFDASELKEEIHHPSQSDLFTEASSWTGRRTLREQVAVVRELAPLAIAEVEALADFVEAKRFNDPVTVDAIKCLRELHTQLGELLAAVEGGSLTKDAVAAIEANRSKLVGLLQEGAKVIVVAPAMTLGVMHLLSWLGGVAVDSTMVSGVFAAILGADVLKSMAKNTSLSAGQPTAP
jgi:hypothetical protein